jgi:hypothetical protein
VVGAGQRGSATASSFHESSPAQQVSWLEGQTQMVQSAESAVASCSPASMFVGVLFGCREVEEAVACLARPHRSRGWRSSPWHHDENGATHGVVMVAADVLTESATCVVDITVKAGRSMADEVCGHRAKASATPCTERGPWARCLGDGVLARRGRRGRRHGRRGGARRWGQSSLARGVVAWLWQARPRDWSGRLIVVIVDVLTEGMVRAVDGVSGDGALARCGEVAEEA